MIQMIILATALIALLAGPAHAGPVVAVIGWIGGVLGGTGIAAALLRIGIGLATSLLSQAIAKKLQKKPEINVQFEIAVGDDTPLNFIVGDFATAGKRKYVGSWGPNTRYITEVIEVSCLPQPGQPKIWVNDEPGNVIWSEMDTYNDRVLVGHEDVQVWEGGSEGSIVTQRRPIYEPRIVQLGHPLTNLAGGDGNRIWLRWIDGSQTEADPMLLAAFGDDPDYPWTEDMIGTGKTYAVITTQYDRVSLSTYPQYLIQPPPLPVYDPRLDSTAGGDGPQRWGDRATYAPSRNNAVIAYNVARGIYFGSEWIFGGRNLPAWRLPMAEWIAAMNACDDPVDLTEGGTEPAFRCGLEIRADMEPLDILEEIGRAANMRFAEVGGMIKPVVGLPGASVFSITDGDIIVTEGQSLRPFAPVAETFNAISATYPEPREKWASKDAPEYIDAAATAADGGRYLPTSVSFPASPYAEQVQRLMRAQLQDYRRDRIHQFSLPPDAYALEPLDVVTWDSARNGYAAKKFVVEKIAKLPGLNVSVALREVEPGDYDWSPAFQMPVQITPPVIVPPWILEVRDFVAAPATIIDAEDQARRPGIRVSVAGGEVGVTEIRIRIYRAGEDDTEFDLTRAYAAPWSWVITEGLLPDTDYEVSVGLISEIGDITWWSDRAAVTTPDVRLGLPDLADAVTEHMAETAELAGVKPVEALPAAGDKPDQIVVLVPDGVLYRWDAGAEEWTRDLYAGIKPGDVTPASFAAGIEPVTVHEGGSLPIVKSTEALYWSGKLYRWNGTAYVASVPAADVTGQMSNAQIAALDAAKLTGTLSPDRIGTGAILSAKLADNAVTTAKISDAAIAAAKLAAGAVTGDKLASGAVSLAKFASGLEPVTIHSGGSLPGVKITEALTWGGKLYRWDGSGYVASVPAADVTGTIVSTQIADAAILASKIAAAAVTNSAVATGAITASKLLIADTANLFPDFDLIDEAFLSSPEGAGYTFVVNTTVESLGTRSILLGAAASDRSVQTGWFPVEGAQDYLTAAVASIAAPGTATVSVYLDLAGIDGSGAPVLARSVLIGQRVDSFNLSAITAEVTTAVAERRGRFRMVRAGGGTVGARAGGFKLQKRYGGTLIVDGAILASKIAAGAVEATKIAAGAVTTIKLAAGAVEADKIAANAIVAGKIAAGTISATELASNSITATKIAAGAVEADKIAANAITAAKIGAGEITTAKLAAGAVVADKIAAGTITATQIASNAITTVKLDAAAVTTAKIAVGAITASEIASNAVTAVKIAAGAVSATKLAAGAVEAEKIAANAIVAGKIAAGAVSADQIAAGAILASKLAIADTANLFPDFNMMDPAFYTSPEGVTLVTVSNTSSADLGNRWATIGVDAAERSLRSLYIPIEGLTDYLASAVASSHSGGTVTSTVMLDLATSDASGNPVFSRAIAVSQRINSFSATAQRVELTTTAAERWARFRFVRSGGGSDIARAGGFKLQKRMGGSLIVDGAIAAAKIAAGAVTANAIAAGAIVSTKIAAGAVTTAKLAAGAITAESGIIADLAVDTLQLAGQSVTIPVAVFNSAVLRPATGDGSQMIVAKIQSEGYPTAISFGCQMGGYDYSEAEFYLRRNGVIIYSFAAGTGPLGGSTSPFSEFVDVAPGTGPVTYSVSAVHGASAVSRGFPSPIISRRSMRLTQTKR